MNEADRHLRVIVFKACQLAVWTDRKMTPEEQRYLSHLTEMLGRTQAEREVLRQLRLQEANEGALFSEIKSLSEAEKRYVFDTCLETLASDRKINRQELRFLTTLRRVCGVGCWSFYRRLSRVRRQSRARVYPRRTIAAVVLILAGLYGTGRYMAYRSARTGMVLEERCTGNEVSVSLFSTGPSAAPLPTGQDVFEKVSDSIVSVVVLVGNNPMYTGSGAVIGTDQSGLLYIVTNRHVIDGPYPPAGRRGNRVRVEVKQYSGAKFDATLDFASRKHDLALLAVKGMAGHARPLPLHLKLGLQVGQRIYAVGSPLGLDHTFTAGVISAFRDSYLQTDATVHSGSSGGPLIDDHGALCAVVTRVHRTKDYGFALYSDMILDVLKERRQHMAHSPGASSQ
ncbi:MAG: trypsin-like peptidase domain-containing protein [Planctomycetota bacterium]|jgi:hypothetical protein